MRPGRHSGPRQAVSCRPGNGATAFRFVTDYIGENHNFAMSSLIIELLARSMLNVVCKLDRFRL